MPIVLMNLRYQTKLEPKKQTSQSEKQTEKKPH